MQKYANVFTGLGRLEKPYNIEEDPTMRVKTELEDKEKRGVIRSVEEPTNWVSSTAIVQKPD